MITVENKNVNIKVEDNSLIVEVEKKVFVTVDGGRGPQGGDSISGYERLLYIANVNREGNFLGNINNTDLLNTTGKNFFWSGLGGVDAVLECSDPLFLDKIINITWYRTDDVNNTAFRVVKYFDSFYFSIDAVLSQYRCVIEFYNY